MEPRALGEPRGLFPLEAPVCQEVIEMVLATDTSCHFQQVKSIKTSLQQLERCGGSQVTCSPVLEGKSRAAGLTAGSTTQEKNPGVWGPARGTGDSQDGWSQGTQPGWIRGGPGTQELRSLGPQCLEKLEESPSPEIRAAAAPPARAPRSAGSKRERGADQEFSSRFKGKRGS